MARLPRLWISTGREADSISRTIQAIGRRYVSYFNYLYNRTGTLWEGRFRSSVVQTDQYLLTCQRYIELNPVRAGMVADPMDFPWSSHRCLAESRTLRLADFTGGHRSYPQQRAERMGLGDR